MHIHFFAYVGPNYVEAFPLYIAERVFRYINRWVAFKFIILAGQSSATAASFSISAAQTISSCTRFYLACRKLRMSAFAASYGRVFLFEIFDREFEVCECCDKMFKSGITGPGSRRAALARSLIIAVRLIRPILRILFNLRCKNRLNFPFTTKNLVKQFLYPDRK